MFKIENVFKKVLNFVNSLTKKILDSHTRFFTVFSCHISVKPLFIK